MMMIDSDWLLAAAYAGLGIFMAWFGTRQYYLSRPWKALEREAGYTFYHGMGKDERERIRQETHVQLDKIIDNAIFWSEPISEDKTEKAIGLLGRSED